MDDEETSKKSIDICQMDSLSWSDLLTYKVKKIQTAEKCVKKDYCDNLNSFWNTAVLNVMKYYFEEGEEEFSCPKEDVVQCK